MRTVTPLELKARLDKGEEIQVIDIREPEKFQAGHMQGALNIFQKDIPAHVDKISRAGMVVICCTYGIKSDQVYLYLREKHKRKNLWILEGGLYDWSRQIDPTMLAL